MADSRAIVRKAPAPRPRSTAGLPPDLPAALDALRRLYGPPSPPPVTDPLALILFENVAYLADDARREEAFRMLETRVGLSPEKILGVPRSVLLDIARFGIVPEQTVEKLRSIAAIALEDFGGDLTELVRRPVNEAIRGLKTFPSIGEPGAEKVLLFSRAQPLLALDSNGLRVLLRLGFGTEDKSYVKSYRSARVAADLHLPRTIDARIEAHQLLRRHGQELCKRSNPRCEICPLRRECVYANRESRSVRER